MNFYNYKQLLFIFGFIIAFGVQGFELTDKTVLVLGKDAIPAEITAANELQKYLKKITGEKLSIVSEFPKSANCIVIGTGKVTRSIVQNIDFEKLRTDEVILKTLGPNTLLVAGARPRGTLYAVYELLEREFKVSL